MRWNWWCLSYLQKSYLCFQLIVGSAVRMNYTLTRYIQQNITTIKNKIWRCIKPIPPFFYIFYSFISAIQILLGNNLSKQTELKKINNTNCPCFYPCFQTIVCEQRLKPIPPLFYNFFLY